MDDQSQQSTQPTQGQQAPQQASGQPQPQSAPAQPPTIPPQRPTKAMIIVAIVGLFILAAGFAAFMLSQNNQSGSQTPTPIPTSTDMMEQETPSQSPTIDPNMSQEEREINEIDLGDIEEEFNQIEEDIDQL